MIHAPAQLRRCAQLDRSALPPRGWASVRHQPRSPPVREHAKALIARFGGACAYCGGVKALVEEHLVPINRTAVGLHAWGNIVPACKDCNDIKAGHPWVSHVMLDETRRAAIAEYVAEYRYAPEVSELQVVLSKLYELADRQTRALVDFGLVASRPYIAGLHTERSKIADVDSEP